MAVVIIMAMRIAAVAPNGARARRDEGDVLFSRVGSLTHGENMNARIQLVTREYDKHCETCTRCASDTIDTCEAGLSLLQAFYSVLRNEDIMMSYKVGVISKSAKNEVVVYNGLRFITEADAKRYADDLRRRWSDVREVTITACFDKANSAYPVPTDRYDVQRTKTK